MRIQKGISVERVTRVGRRKRTHIKREIEGFQENYFSLICLRLLRALCGLLRSKSTAEETEPDEAWRGAESSLIFIYTHGPQAVADGRRMSSNIRRNGNLNCCKKSYEMRREISSIVGRDTNTGASIFLQLHPTLAANGVQALNFRPSFVYENGALNMQISSRRLNDFFCLFTSSNPRHDPGWVFRPQSTVYGSVERGRERFSTLCCCR